MSTDVQTPFLRTPLLPLVNTIANNDACRTGTRQPAGRASSQALRVMMRCLLSVQVVELVAVVVVVVAVAAVAAVAAAAVVVVIVSSHGQNWWTCASACSRGARGMRYRSIPVRASAMSTAATPRQNNEANT